MKEKKLKSWEDFERELVSINERTNVLQQQGQLSRMEYPLYRGVSDSEYHLESTLDRIQKGMDFSKYHKIIKIVHKHVATCTGRKFDIDTKVPLGEFDLPAYEFMAYLRHNGFPSPLIDWSKSPYVAAFFAFRDIYSRVKHVSIFVYRGDLMYGDIHLLGPTIATHRTHYLQQSEYTICFRKETKNIYFANHEDIEEPDVLIKYVIPVSEQQKVLRKLDLMNITAYSLFGSKSSLMETLALQEICFEIWDRLLASKNE